MKLWQAKQDSIPNLDNSTIVSMTGRTLWESLAKDNKAQLNTYCLFIVGPNVWQIWRTMGQGKNYGNVYTHIMLRDAKWHHYRGKESEMVGDFCPA